MSDFEATPGRLDRVVADRLGVPRAEAQRAISAGRVLVDGQSRPKSFALAGGERVEADLSLGSEILPEGPPVPVRYEDRFLFVVSKPAGIPTHATASRRSGTLVNRLLGMGVALSSGYEPDRPGIVHRLDLGTSGLLVVAKDDETHKALASMFKEHAVSRRYLAMVRGRVEHERFAVEAPLARRGARVVVRRGQGREAETEFEVRERLAAATLLEAAPRTGRTHQIRVHLMAVGHPIVGDRTYGGGGDLARKLRLERSFLHSWRIAFDHPRTDERIEVEEGLPADLERALERARAS